jgi:hypothetical protein
MASAVVEGSPPGTISRSPAQVGEPVRRGRKPTHSHAGGGRTRSLRLAADSASGRLSGGSLDHRDCHRSPEQRRVRYLPWAGIRVIPSVRFERQVVNAGPRLNRTFVGVNSFMLPRPGLPGLLGGLTARGNIEIEAGMGMSNASLFLDTAAARSPRQAAPPGTAQVRRRSPYDRGRTPSAVICTMTASPDRHRSKYLGLDDLQPRTEWMDFSGAGAPARRLASRVFLDRNADGGTRKPLISGVRVIIGRGFGVSDARGRYRYWDWFRSSPRRSRGQRHPAVPAVDSAPMAVVELAQSIPAAGHPRRGRRGDRAGHGPATASPRGLAAGVVLTATHKATGEVRPCPPSPMDRSTPWACSRRMDPFGRAQCLEFSGRGSVVSDALGRGWGQPSGLEIVIR